MIGSVSGVQWGGGKERSPEGKRKGIKREASFPRPESPAPPKMVCLTNSQPYFSERKVALLSPPKMELVTADAEKDPLWIASKNQQWDQVKELLKSPNANINIVPLIGPDKGISALWWAMLEQEYDLVREMLKFPKPNLNASPADNYCTVLGLAVSYCDWHMTEEMLEYPNPDVSTVSEDGTSVLWWLNFYKKQDIVKKILTRPDINIPSVKTALLSRSRRFRQSALDYILKDGELELIFYCIFKYHLIGKIDIRSHKDERYFEDVQANFIETSKRVISGFFDPELNCIDRDLRVRLCQETIFAELGMESLYNFSDIDTVMYNWIHLLIRHE
jgi:hypothetical protein